jgi:hypothetical protein
MDHFNLAKLSLTMLKVGLSMSDREIEETKKGWLLFIDFSPQLPW